MSADFFGDEDYAAYRRLLSTSCRAYCTQVLVYCLMPNHVHLTLVPDDDLVSVRPLSELIFDCARFIGEPDTTDIADLLHAHAGTGRPLGPDSFVGALAGATCRAPSQATKARAEATATRLSHLGPLSVAGTEFDKLSLSFA